MFIEAELSTWTEADYDRALAEIEALMHFDPGTPENLRLETIGSLVEQYETIHWHVPAPSLESRERYAYGADNVAERAPMAVSA